MCYGKDTPFWNGAYFISNYLMLAILFMESRDKCTRVIGVSLSLTILLFSVLKFFISLDTVFLDFLNIFTFILIFVGLYKLDKTR